MIEGSPTLLVHKGQVVMQHLRRERIRLEELRTMLRKHGIHDLSEVHLAILEADGSLTIEKKTEKQ